MQSFKNFLVEHADYLKHIDEEIDSADEKIVHVNDSGDVVEEDVDDDFYSYENFDAIMEDDEDEEQISESKSGGTTWGGEYIIDLNFDDETPDGEENLNEKETPTVTHLRKRTARTMDQVKDDGQQYVIQKNDDGGYTIMRKKYTEKTRHPLSKEEIEDIVNRKNGVGKKPKKEPTFDFDENNNFLKNGKKIPKNRKKKFIQQLNELAKKVFGAGEVHYKWEFEKGEDGKDTDIQNNHILVNTTPWDDSDELDNDRFDAAEYKRVESDEDKSRLLELLRSAVKKIIKKAEADGGEIGYDFEKNEFTRNGSPMTPDELRAFVKGLNGNVSDNDDNEYWNHFKISIKGSKVGDIANFSLPPVETCNREAPCISDGCYAVKAYGMYPASRVAMDINLALLREGKFDQFEKELNTVLRRVYGKTVGAMKEGEKIHYFRFHVSGDVFSPEYFRAMCRVAKANPGVGFWTYTKQYGILEECKKDIPDNMSVLVSCWGKFRPKLWMNGKYANLEDEFTLAYLDDGTPETENYIDGNATKGVEPFVCPCTDYSETEVHCNKCLRCYEVNKLKNNLKFKKH